MRIKLTMNSVAKACPYPTEGTVTPPLMKGLKTAFTANAALTDAKICVPIYTGTCKNQDQSKKKNKHTKLSCSFLMFLMNNRVLFAVF